MTIVCVMLNNRIAMHDVMWLDGRRDVTYPCKGGRIEMSLFLCDGV